LSASRALALSAAEGWRPSLEAALSQGRAEARAILGNGSKSFALAGMLLGKRARDDAAVLYAWCRRADDVIDEAGPGEAPRALRALGRQLDDLFAGRVRAPLDFALCELLARREIPKEYFRALLDGFAMDAQGASYRTLADLDLYGYRVAGVVGLMMCHVLGVLDERCLKAAAHLGMAMQLTNIARDVAEDFRRGRQYLPTMLLSAEELGDAMRAHVHHPGRGHVVAAVEVLLRRADRYYASGLSGLCDLGWRDALAIGAAARIYRGIGRILARRGFDPLRGRAVVSPLRKCLSAAVAALTLVVQGPRRWRRRVVAKVPNLLVGFDDVQT
jgi:15-cis-phytoene synthase